MPAIRGHPNSFNVKPNRFSSPRRRGSRNPRKHVVVLGAGGNIGSHLVALLARLAVVERLTLVDGDRYTERNRETQAIRASDVGKAKATAVARIARSINPMLQVLAIVDWLENVPLGIFRSDLIAACLDSKESRQQANEIAWRLGVPWIDAGVEASQMLARVNVYVPGKDQPCLECAWSERDYAELATVHACDGGAAAAPPTNAPACLGALAAALQGIECQKVLAGQTEAALIGRQVLLDARTHRHFITTFRRNSNCRFDHGLWQIERLRKDPRKLSVGTMLRLIAPASRSAGLAFGGRPIIKRLHCPRCGFMREVFRLQQRLRPGERLCERCHRPMLSAGFHMKTRLSRADLGPGDAHRSLGSLGLRAGDVVSLNDGMKERFFELGFSPVNSVRKRRSTAARTK